MTFTSAVIDLKNAEEDRGMIRAGISHRPIFIFMDELQVRAPEGHFVDAHFTIEDYIADDWVTFSLEDEDPD